MGKLAKQRARNQKRAIEKALVLERLRIWDALNRRGSFQANPELDREGKKKPDIFMLNTRFLEEIVLPPTKADLSKEKGFVDVIPAPLPHVKIWEEFAGRKIEQKSNGLLDD